MEILKTGSGRLSPAKQSPKRYVKMDTGIFSNLLSSHKIFTPHIKYFPGGKEALVPKGPF
jgi:hypothetical protein